MLGFRIVFESYKLSSTPVGLLIAFAILSLLMLIRPTLFSDGDRSMRKFYDPSLCHEPTLLFLNV